MDAGKINQPPPPLIGLHVFVIKWRKVQGIAKADGEAFSITFKAQYKTRKVKIFKLSIKDTN